MAHLLVAGLASVGVFLIWFALARTVVDTWVVQWWKKEGTYLR
jgi:hypothetical protein